MPRFTRLLLAASFIFISLAMWGQQADRFNDAGLLARLAYESSPVVQRGTIRQICIAITRDGEYRIVRSTVDKPTEFLRGQMPQKQFERLKGLLTAPKFRSQSSRSGALIRQESESFRVEILGKTREHADGTQEWLESETWRLQWLNADDADPFPAPIAKVVDWLQRFEPKDGKAFEYTEFPDVCPAGGLRLVQPAVADNHRP
jgi:hypothetical protein